MLHKDIYMCRIRDLLYLTHIYWWFRYIFGLYYTIYQGLSIGVQYTRILQVVKLVVLDKAPCQCSRRPEHCTPTACLHWYHQHCILAQTLLLSHHCRQTRTVLKTGWRLHQNTRTRAGASLAIQTETRRFLWHHVVQLGTIVGPLTAIGCTKLHQRHQERH